MPTLGTFPGEPMLRSMTAFASAESDIGSGTLSIEIRSVNHRYLELGLRVPEELRNLEPQIRERVAAKLSRGKVDLGMRYKPAAAAASAIALDEALVARLGETAQALAAKFPQLNVDFVALLGWPGVMLERENDQESLRAAALRVLDEAIATAEATGERNYSAELHRLRGEVLRDSSTGAAEAAFVRALAIAREQKALMPELRAAMSLVDLAREHGRTHTAAALVQPLLARFSEGFDTPDLVDARAMVEAG